MARSGFGFPAGERDVNRVLAKTAVGPWRSLRNRDDLEHREALADRLDLSEALEEWPQSIDGDPEHFEIEIFRREPQQFVADGSTDEQRPAPRLQYRLGDRARELRKRVRHLAPAGAYFFITRSARAGATTESTASHHAFRYV